MSTVETATEIRSLPASTFRKRRSTIFAGV